MQPMRSILFVPGNRESWPAKAVAAGADAVAEDGVRAVRGRRVRQPGALAARASGGSSSEADGV